MLLILKRNGDMFTIVSSAGHNNLDPWAYLSDVLTRLAELRDTAAGGSREQLLSLLPDRCPKDRVAARVRPGGIGAR